MASRALTHGSRADERRISAHAHAHKLSRSHLGPVSRRHAHGQIQRHADTPTIVTRARKLNTHTHTHTNTHTRARSCVFMCVCACVCVCVRGCVFAWDDCLCMPRGCVGPSCGTAATGVISSSAGGALRRRVRGCVWYHRPGVVRVGRRFHLDEPYPLGAVE